MAQKLANIMIPIDGMTCINCENRIENVLRKTEGIKSVDVSYTKGRAMVTFDANLTDQRQIERLIESLDYRIRRTLPTSRPMGKKAGQDVVKYSMQKSNINQIIGVGIVLAVLLLVINQFGGFKFFNEFPVAQTGMGFGLLFVIGLLTSVHCVAMCGGINLSQCVRVTEATSSGGSRFENIKPSLLYNTGRVISYTLIGGVVGALGSVVSFSGKAKGFVAITAGVFMVVMGLNMLNVFPGLRKLNPRMPKIFARKINEKKAAGSNSPFYIGLLNGLMPCGPLQAMQLYALSTGSPVKGALSMLFFSLGTVPLMFGLGALSALLSRKFTQRMVQVSALLVVILGVVMFQNGLGVSGIALPTLSMNLNDANTANAANTTDAANTAIASKARSLAAPVVENGVQLITTQLRVDRYEPITVQAGVPVKWTIQATEENITGCNNRLLIPEYKVEKQLVPGDNVIEFIPAKTGTIPYSCWMGMIRSKITVVE